MSGFEVSIYDSDYSLAYSKIYHISDNELKVYFSGSLKEDKENTLFVRKMTPTQIGRIHRLIDGLALGDISDSYSNDCVEDGSQISIRLRIEDSNKSIHLSNYYLEDVAGIIQFVNTLTPSEHKILYEKDELIASQEECDEWH